MYNKKEKALLNMHFVMAETMVKTVVDRLNKILYIDGNISYYNPQALDEAIMKLIDARSEMAKGRIFHPL